MKNYNQHHTQRGKTESLSSKIRNKIRMSAFTALIQHTTGNSSHSYKQTRRRNKRYPNWKARRKLSLFTDGMILYIENPMAPPKNYKT